LALSIDVQLCVALIKQRKKPARRYNGPLGEKGEMKSRSKSTPILLSTTIAPTGMEIILTSCSGRDYHLGDHRTCESVELHVSLKLMFKKPNKQGKRRRGPYFKYKLQSGRE